MFKPLTRASGVREVLNFLWRVFGFIGAALGLRRWWRTLVNDEEPPQIRLLAGLLLLLMAGLLLFSLFMPRHLARPAEAPQPAAVARVEARGLVVDFYDEVAWAEIDALGRGLGLAFTANSPSAAPRRLTVADAGLLTPERRAAVLARLQADPRVEVAEEDFEMQLLGWRIGVPGPLVVGGRRSAFEPNDPRYPEQWHMKLIGMPQAWEKATGEGAVVAVIDTGCAFEAKGDIPAASDLKGVKFVKPYDFVNKTKAAYDDHGHGTHVAGTIAQATNNGHGTAGVAYNASIMPLKVLTEHGSGMVSDIADAIRYAVDNGAHIINMSLGGPRASTVLARACTYANQRGVTIVCAAGNSSREGVGFPAAYPECIAVSAVGPDGNLSFYSSWGKEVAVAAPGGNYRSPSERANGVLQNTVFGKQDVFEFWQGTSMASPHVAGVAALIWESGTKGPAGIKATLQRTATNKGDKTKYGAGLINAAAAVGVKSADTTARAAVAPMPRAPLVPPRAPLALAGLALALLGLVLGLVRRPAFWLGGALPIVLLTCVGTGFAGAWVTPVVGAAVWPLLVLAGLWGVRGLRPGLAGVCAGYAAGAATVGLLGWGPLAWLLTNAALAAGLAWMATRD